VLNTLSLTVRSGRSRKRSPANTDTSWSHHGASASASRPAAATSCRKYRTSHKRHKKHKTSFPLMVFSLCFLCLFVANLPDDGFEARFHHAHHLTHVKPIGLGHQRLPV